MRRGMFYTEPVGGLTKDMAWLAEQGWDVVVGGDDPALQSAAREHGMTPWSCLGAFTPPDDDPALLCVDINGQRQRWFGSGCPNHPVIRASSRERHRRAAAREQVAGVMLDGIRFASPASGLAAFCTCFCEHCARAASQLGLDFSRMRRDVTTLHHHLASGLPPALLDCLRQWPGLSDWLLFRQQTITACARELADVVHIEGKQIGAYLFSPCLAPLVGQEYASLAPALDVIAPMLYRNVNEPNCIAPINTELHVIASWASPTADPSWVLALAGLPSTGIAGLDDLLTRGVSPEAVRVETARARALIGPDILLSPILWWDDHEAKQTADGAMRSGADGIQVFRFTSGVRERRQWLA